MDMDGGDLEIVTHPQDRSQDTHAKVVTSMADFAAAQHRRFRDEVDEEEESESESEEESDSDIRLDIGEADEDKIAAFQNDVEREQKREVELAARAERNPVRVYGRVWCNGEREREREREEIKWKSVCGEAEC